MLDNINDLKEKQKVGVAQIYPINSEQKIYATLENYDWDFSRFGLIYLCINNQKIKMNYIGYGNIQNKPVLSLSIADNKYKTVDDICKLSGENMYIVRL